MIFILVFNANSHCHAMGEREFNKNSQIGENVFDQSVDFALLKENPVSAM